MKLKSKAGMKIIFMKMTINHFVIWLRVFHFKTLYSTNRNQTGVCRLKSDTVHHCQQTSAAREGSYSARRLIEVCNCESLQQGSQLEIRFSVLLFLLNYFPETIHQNNFTTTLLQHQHAVKRMYRHDFNPVCILG